MLPDLLTPYGIEHQLSIPYQLDDVQHRAFVLSRDQADFSDHDMELAARLQPLLLVLDRQVSALARAHTIECDGSALTGGELAVLRLLAEGMTASAIGHRLGSSPRTVQKHLEHIYRKLGVSNRTTALKAAAEADLIPAAPRRRAIPATPGLRAILGQRTG